MTADISVYPDVLVLEFKAMMKTNGSAPADLQRLKEFADDLKTLCEDYGASAVVREIRWSADG